MTLPLQHRPKLALLRWSALVLLLAFQPQSTRAQTTEASVDQYLQPYLETGNFSGSVLIAKDGEILLSKGYGLADREVELANGPDTIYHLASVSRTFTSAAILLLEQQGKLSVADPLSKHLPDWPRGDQITLHHLLTLSAGFPNLNSLPRYNKLLQSPQSPAAMAETFRDLPLEYEPGARSVHSNSNYVLLALLVEKLSGKSFGEFLKKEMFLPLGMTRTAHDDDRETPTNSARGYSPAGLADIGKAPEIHWSGKAGHGSLYSTTEDLYRFDRALAKHSLLGEKAVDKLFAEHFESNGYGWFVRENHGSKEVYINGRSPGFGGFWVRSIDHDATVIVLGNLYNSVTTTIGRDLLAMALGESYDPAPFHSRPPDPTLLAELAGSYKMGPDFYAPNRTVRVQVRDGHLFNGVDWVMPTTTGELTFKHRRYWSDLVFVRDADGKVTELRYDSFVGKRLP